jgi:hypothetical protein
MTIFCFVRKTVQKANRHSSDLYESAGQMTAGSSALSSFTYSTLGRRRSALPPDRPVESQTRRVQTVAVQAALYVLAFILNYTWTTALRIIGANERYWTDEYESELFGLLVMQAIFLPCQGVFNVIVFSRPRYWRIRKKFPDQSRIWAFRMALFDGAEKMPQKKQTVEVPTAERATTQTGMASHKEVKSPPLCQVEAEEEDKVDAEKQKGDTGVRASAVASSPTEDMSTSKIVISASLESSDICRSKPSVRLKRLSKHFSSNELRVKNTPASNNKGLLSASVGAIPQSRAGNRDRPILISFCLELRTIRSSVSLPLLTTGKATRQVRVKEQSCVRRGRKHRGARKADELLRWNLNKPHVFWILYGIRRFEKAQYLARSGIWCTTDPLYPITVNHYFKMKAVISMKSP